MGFQGKDGTPKKKSFPNSKKPLLDIEKLAKNVLEKIHRRCDDQEDLLESDVADSGICTSGRSIEVLLDDTQQQECICSGPQSGDVSAEDCVNSSMVNSKACSVCSSRKGRRVTFSGNVLVVACEGQDSCSNNKRNSLGKKRKKHRKLRKARKWTWRVMKSTWKCMKTGIQVMAVSPGMHAGTIINTPATWADAVGLMRYYPGQPVP